MVYRIVPPMGIARIGNSRDEFFIGPEVPGSLGTEIRNDGVEVPVQRFKDSQFRLRRQAARFRVFEFDDAGGSGRPARLPADATIRWTVKLANKKDAIIRRSRPLTEQVDQPPPPFPELDATRANRAIAAEAVAPLPGAPAVTLAGTYLTGTALQESVLLGKLMTDREGNLLVLGGHGVSRSPEGKPIGDEVLNGEVGGGFYNNRGWYDDVSDGPVLAEIHVPGRSPITVQNATVIVAPPDFAPGTPAVVTLYDVLLQVAIARQELVLPARPSFSRDIWPLLRRAAGLRWVNRRTASNSGVPYWDRFSTDWQALSNTSATGPSAELRQATAKLLRDIQPKRALANFSLRPWQRDYLAAWEAGDFDADFDGTIPGEGVLSPKHLTRTVLDATAGQGFFPGIEAGILLVNPTLYSAAFRIAPGVAPGTLTAQMALPWQADFLKCEENWWPSQRPDSAAQPDDPDTFLRWVRPIDESDRQHRNLVAHVSQLGVIVPRQLDGQNVFVEVDRDPAL